MTGEAKRADKLDGERLTASYLYLLYAGASRLGLPRRFAGHDLPFLPKDALRAEEAQPLLETLLHHLILILARLGGWRRQRAVVADTLREVDVYDERLWTEKRVTDHALQALEGLRKAFRWHKEREAAREAAVDETAPKEKGSGEAKRSGRPLRPARLKLEGFDPKPCSAADHMLLFFARIALPAAVPLPSDCLSNGLVSLYLGHLDPLALEALLDEHNGPVFLATGRRLRAAFADRAYGGHGLYDDLAHFEARMGERRAFLDAFLEACASRRYYRSIDFALEAYDRTLALAGLEAQGAPFDGQRAAAALRKLTADCSASHYQRAAKAFGELLAGFWQLGPLRDAVVERAPVDRNADEKYLLSRIDEEALEDRMEQARMIRRNLTGALG